LKIKEAELVQLMKDGKTNQEIASHFGCAVRSVQSFKVRLAKRGFSPDSDMDHLQHSLFMVKGQSTYYDKEGKPTQRWVKTKYDQGQWEEYIRNFMDGISSDVPRALPVPAPSHYRDDRLNLFPLTDYHLGMLAWGEESGDDWDMNIAENLAVKWLEAAIQAAPNAGTAILANMGDFLHWDGLSAVTPTSHHVLDADSRYTKLVRVAIRLIRRLIDMLLATHNQVHVIMAEGNHDEASSVWLREALCMVYENEPRITWDKRADPYYVYEFGKTALYFHHGHKKRIAQVDQVFASKFRDVYGRTQYGYAHVGHLHHLKALETNLMVVEQHRTLAAKDAYASRGGWLSERSAAVITYHREHGEITRNTLTPSMLD